MLKTICIICIFMALFVFITSGKPIKTALFTVFSGYGALAILYILTRNLIGFNLINKFSLFLTTLFGIPGLIGFLMIKLIFLKF